MRYHAFEWRSVSQLRCDRPETGPQRVAVLRPDTLRNLHQLPHECWFERLGWPFEYKLFGTGYCYIMDDIQELCPKYGVLPCVLDASIFNQRARGRLDGREVEGRILNRRLPVAVPSSPRPPRHR